MAPDTTMCRICLAKDVRLFTISASLQPVFETITKTALHTPDKRPVALCCICYHHLKKCSNLMSTSAIAESVLTLLLNAHSAKIGKAISESSTLGLAKLVVSKTECYDCCFKAPVEIKIELDTQSETNHGESEAPPCPDVMDIDSDDEGEQVVTRDLDVNDDDVKGENSEDDANDHDADVNDADDTDPFAELPEEGEGGKEKDLGQKETASVNDETADHVIDGETDIITIAEPPVEKQADKEKHMEESRSGPLSTNKDEDVRQILTAWDLQEYIDVFEKNKISLESLCLLDQHMIKEIFPLIGDRAIFTKNLENYKSITNENQQTSGPPNGVVDQYANEKVATFSEHHLDPFTDATNMQLFQMESEKQNDTATLFSSTPNGSESMADDSLDQPSTSFLNSTAKEDSGNSQKKLLQLLESSIEGRIILNLHREEGLLNNTSRRKLCNIIIKELIGDDPHTTITSSDLSEMACQIKAIFKKENVSTYFIPYIYNKKLKIRSAAKGKLYDCLNNRKRQYRLAQKNLGNNWISKAGDEANEEPVVKTRKISDDLAWIKVSTEPWKLLEEKWRSTTKYRQEQAKNMTTCQYVAQYPGLKKPTGYNLLCIDFDAMYPEKRDNLHKYFMATKNHIFELAKTKYQSNASMNDMITSMLEEIDQRLPGNTDEAANITAFLMLPLLISPPLVKKGKKNWRPSKLECKDGFIMVIERGEDLQEIVKKRREKYKSRGLTLQPSIFIVGENLRQIEHYFVLVDSIFYTANTIVQAVDICFKSYQALHCEYSLECETVWNFIQKGFYKITTSFDKNFVAVNSLLSDLHLLEEKA